MALPQIKTWVALALLTGAVGGARERQISYKIEILPVPPGCQSSSQLHGLGEQDRVIGMLTCEGSKAQRAVLWERGRLLELGSFGGPNSMPFGLSPRGEVVGTADTPADYDGEDHVTRPFRWLNGQMKDLGTLGGPLGGAAAINASGTVVGSCQPADSDPRLGAPPFRACIWQHGAVRDLGDLGGPDVFAYDVNGKGWIVGNSNTREAPGPEQGFVDHAFLYDGKTMRDLGTLGGPASLAYSINESGDVVGFSSTGEHLPEGYPVVHGFLWRAGKLFDLESLGGPASQALGINAQDQIVGWSQLVQPRGTVERRAVLWQEGGILDLNNVALDSKGWVLREAWAIDDNGRILANATQGDDRRVVILTPSPGA